nr:DUF1684 domain-containing protein [uncultured Brumimicrobium sp.]
MKTNFRRLLNVGLTLLISYSTLNAQDNYMDSLQNVRDEFNQKLLHTDSIINPEEQSIIASLSYFEIDRSWILTAKFKKKKGKVFEMPTTTTRKPEYRRIGYLHFKRNGEKFKLAVYKSVGFTLPKYKDYVFIPFKDGNAPEKTYGGGRYLDLEITDDMKTVKVDFNTAYNPYCVYSHRYSCPITPEENHIEIKVEAGVKNPVMKEE